MFLKLRPFLYSLIFLLGLELIVLRPAYVAFISFFLFLFSFFGGRRIGGRWIFSVLPVFFSLSSLALLYLVTLAYEQQIFIFLSAAMYYLSLLGASRLGDYSKDQSALAMNAVAAFATIFFTFAGAYGFYLNFLVPLYYLMAVYLAVALLVSYQYFVILNPEKKASIRIYSFLLALIMAELAWAMNFWPFGYLTAGVSALILYYVLWDMTRSHFLNLLSKKRVVANVAFFSALIILVLLSSKWIPVI